jgi:dephospho-CoA kinase
MKKQIIIGLAGKMASGKAAVGEYFVKKYGAKKIRFSDPLRQILDVLDLPDSRQNLQMLSTSVRQNFGDDILSKAAMKLVSRLNDDILVIDGVRRTTDIENFKKLKNFFLIYIEASLEKRYERSIARAENPDDREMTRKEFEEKDEAEPEARIETLREAANFLINNNGTLEETYNQIEKILNEINKI